MSDGDFKIKAGGSWWTGFFGTQDMGKSGDRLAASGDTNPFGISIELEMHREKSSFEPAFFFDWMHGSVSNVISVANILPMEMPAPWDTFVDSFPDITAHSEYDIFTAGSRLYFPFLENSENTFKWEFLTLYFGVGLSYAYTRSKNVQPISDTEDRIYRSTGHEFGAVLDAGLKILKLGVGPVAIEAGGAGRIFMGSMFSVFGGLDAKLSFEF